MAWALVNSDGTIHSVTFDKAHSELTSQISYVEISEQRAVDVMTGIIKLYQCLATDAEISAAAQPVNVAGKYWSQRYPAMMGEVDVDALANISRLIPAYGVAVETGSRLGGSSKIILDHAPDIKRLYCVDPEWAMPDSPGITDPYMDDLAAHWNIDRSQSCFTYASGLLSGYPQARLLALSSPYDFNWWTEPIDFIFEDSSHANPQLRDNLDFWVPLVKSGGIIAGHDYAASHWPDVAVEAHSLRDQLGAELNVQGSVWWLIKP